MTLTNNGQGVLFAYTSDSSIENVITSNNYCGIYLRCSGDNNLTGNAVSDNEYGIFLYRSGNNNLTDNAVSDNEYGIYLCSSNNNSFMDNTIPGNEINQDGEVNHLPVANAGGLYVGDEGSPIIFDGSGSYDPDGTIESCSWDFGDGTVATDLDLSPSHTYGDNGEYILTLTVTDNNGLSATATTTVTVANVVPVVDAGLDQTEVECCIDEVSFSGSFTDPGGADTHTIEWDFGDGDTATGTLTPTYKYCQVDTYTVTLTVTDDDSGQGSDSLMVNVVDTTPPEVTISSPEDGKTYANTQGQLPIEYIAEDRCDPDLHIAMTLDREPFTGDSINLCGIASGEHTLVITATDDAENVAQASATFLVELQPLRNFVISRMTINWASDADDPCGKKGFGSWFKRFKWFRWFNRFVPKEDDTFSISGRLRVPKGYTVADLKKSATVTIFIASSSGSDTVVFEERPLRRRGVMWRYSGDDQPPGEGMNITKMTIWWAPQRDKWTSWGGFYIRGVLELPEDIGINTEPAEAMVVMQIPVTMEAGGGSLIGEETVVFKVSKKWNRWLYHVGRGLPHFPYGPPDTD